MSTCGKPAFKTLIAVDGGKESEAAFDHYIDLVHSEEKQLILVHCSEKPHIPTFSWRAGGSFPSEKIEEVIKQHNEKAEEIHSKYLIKLQTKKVNATWKVVDTDHASVGKNILDIAESEKVDMIVTGSRGLSSLKRTIMRSVSDHIIHHAKCSTMVCHNE